MKLPTLYLPHGGGPCFFMDWTMGPPDTWDRMAAWLRGIDASLPEKPRALLVVSAHWEAPVPTVISSAAPALLYDYYGFPPHTYELKWPAPGAPELASRVRHLLSGAGLESGEDRDLRRAVGACRGWHAAARLPGVDPPHEAQAADTDAGRRPFGRNSVVDAELGCQFRARL